MKKTQREPVQERALKKQKKHYLNPVSEDQFGEAMRNACLRPGCRVFSNQPVVVRAMDSSCWLPSTVAYWPANEAIGLRVWKALDDEDNEHSGCTGDSADHLIGYFMAFDQPKCEKKLCKIFQVPELAALGVLRHVGSKTNKTTVDAALLDVREFRLDLQY